MFQTIYTVVITTPVNIVDQLLSFSLKDLAQVGLFTGQNKSICIKIRATESINVKATVCRKAGKKYLHLEHVHDDTALNYPVEIVELKANLTKGKVSYFICPVSGCKCSRLYLYKSHFISRNAIPRTRYTQQTLSKNQLNGFRVIRDQVKAKKIVEQSKQPHFMKTYAGAETKRMGKVKQAQLKLAA